MAEHGRGSPPGKLTDAERERIGANARAILERELGLQFGREDRRGWSHALCPLHAEKSPSFGVGRDGAIRCQGCGFHGDVIAALEKALGCSTGDAIRRARGAEQAETRRRPGPRPSPDSVSRDNGRLVSPVHDDAPELEQQRGEVARYAYRDAAGRVLLYVVRIEPGRGGPGTKDCIPWTLRRWPDGRTSWRPVLQGVAPRPLYGRETLEAGRPVLFVEGEKTANAARRLWSDLAVVTTIGGAGQENQQHELEALTGHVVVFWPDHDTAGEKYAHALARRVLEAGAARVALVDVPAELPAKWDLADVGPDFTAEQARTLIDAALAEDIASEDVLEQRDAAGEVWNDDFEGFDPGSLVANLPDFPLDTLPAVLRETAEAVAASPLADPAMAATACLVAVGNAAALKCGLRIAGLKTLYSNIAGVLVAGVAEGKSTAVGRAEAATLAAMKAADVDRSAAVRSYRRRLELLEELEQQARSKWKADRTESTEQELDDAERELEECRRSPVLSLSYLVGDVTPAQVSMTMHNNEGRAFVCSAEASFFGNLTGRFRSKEESGLLEIESTLQGLTNEPVRVSRKKADPIVVERTALSILIGMHPESLTALRKHEELVHRGFFSRVVCVFAKPHAHRRRAEDLRSFRDATDTFRAFNGIVESLTTAPLPPDDPLFPPLVTVTPEAVTAWERFYDEIHEQIGPGGRLEPIEGWAKRSPETVQRIALTIHCAKNPGTFLEQPLSEGTMAAAVRLMREYFLPHAWAFHYGAPSGVVATDAEYLARRWHERAVETGRRVVTLTELTVACEPFRVGGKDIVPVLGELIRRGIAHELPAERGHAGRPARRFEIHPRFKPAEI